MDLAPNHPLGVLIVAVGEDFNGFPPGEIWPGKSMRAGEGLPDHVLSLGVKVALAVEKCVEEWSSGRRYERFA